MLNLSNNNQNSKYGVAFAVIAGIVFLLLGCDSNNTTQIDRYLKVVKAKKIQFNDSIPQFQEIKPYVREGQQKLRNPFIPNLKNTNIVKARINRVKNPLEMFGLEALKMLGTVKIKNDLWAIVKAPDGIAYKVKKGDYIGKQYGRIIKVAEKKIDINELVPMYGGFENKNTFLAILE